MDAQKSAKRFVCVEDIEVFQVQQLYELESYNKEKMLTELVSILMQRLLKDGLIEISEREAIPPIYPGCGKLLTCQISVVLPRNKKMDNRI